MSRQSILDCLAQIGRMARRSLHVKSHSGHPPYTRGLRIEPLEERQLLSITVNTLVDENDGIGVGGISLRDAIVAASATDTISFAPSLTASGQATIQLTHGQLVVDKHLTINGPGANLLTVRADPSSRIFNIDDGTAGQKTVSIHGLTLTGGHAGETLTSGQIISDDGGAIRNAEDLTVTACKIEDNSANRFGGGIASISGRLQLVDSSISGNTTRGTLDYAYSSGMGGGIAAFNYLSLIRSLVSGNSSGGAGGGIFSSNADLAISDSTISGNATDGNGGGLYLKEIATQSLAVRYSTITQNFSGGIFIDPHSPGALEIDHTIVADNGSRQHDISGSAVVSFSLVGDRTDASITDLGGNLLGTSAVQIDPMLAPLADNGGLTWTHALYPGSPATNAGDAAAVAGVGLVPQYDQRGGSHSRIIDGRIDIGAFEGSIAPNFVVNTLIDENDGISVGGISLRDAIAAAAPGNVISFAPSLTSGGPATIFLTHGELSTTTSLSVIGPGANLLTVDAQQQSRIFNIFSSDFTIQGLTLTHGRTFGDNLSDDTFSGGAIRFEASGELTLSHDVITASSTHGKQASGGGIFATGAVLLTSCTVNGNTTFGRLADGGGVNAGYAIVQNSTISGNATHGPGSNGGGIASGSVQLFDSLVNSNTCHAYYDTNTADDYGGAGGGIFSSSEVEELTSIVMRGSVVSGNSIYGHTVFSRSADGGGIYSDGGVRLVDSSVSGNSTHGQHSGGGGIFSKSAVSLANSTVSGNTVTAKQAQGGGIAGGSVSLTDSSVSNNRLGYASYYGEDPEDYGGAAGGGGISASDSLVLLNSLVSNNSTYGAKSTGGGIRVRSLSPLAMVTITNSTVSGNKTYGAFAYGGGVDADAVPVALNYSTVVGNSVSGLGSWGGGVFGFGANSIRSSIVASNSAIGAASDLTLAPITIVYSLISDNSDTSLLESHVPDGSGNLIGSSSGAGVINPLLGALADNGGPTKTHALLPGSPAIDRGDPTAVAGVNSVPSTDQRGTPFSRIADGDAIGGARADMGAVEFQFPVGDYNHNNVVDAADYVVWRRTLGSTINLQANGDDSGTSAGKIDQADLTAWRSNFGNQFVVVDDFGNGATSAEWISTASITSGTIDITADTDWFRFTATAGLSHRFTTTLAGLGSSKLRLIGTDGVSELAFDNDGGAAAIDWTPSVAGTYFLEVSGAASSSGSYFLNVSRDDHADFPALATHVTALSESAASTMSGVIGSTTDVDWFQFTTIVGESYLLQSEPGTLANTVLSLVGSDGMTVLVTDSDGGAGNIMWIAPTTGTYYLKVTGQAGTTGNYELKTNFIDDHANSSVGATAVALPSVTGGIIETPNDVDYFRINTIGGITYRFKTILGTLPDTVLDLYSTNGTSLLATNDDYPGLGLASHIDWTAPSSGTYYLAVSSADIGTYQISVAVIGFTQQAQLFGGSAQMGVSVALSSDGNTALVGSVLDDVGVNVDQGAAYVYTRSGNTWTQQAKLTASDGVANDYFALSVSLSSDGNFALIGTRLDDVGANVDQGSAYVFTRNGATWTQQAKLTASNGADGDEFGFSVSISNAGSTALIGARLDDVGANTDQGSAYVFVRSGSVWTQQAQLMATGGAGSDFFGSAVALSGNGSNAIVGAILDDIGANANQGSAYVFTRGGTTWTQQAQLNGTGGAASDAFGSSVSMNFDGSTAIVGVPLDDVGSNVDQGSAFIFTRVGNSWSQQSNLTGTNGQFGYSVALLNSGGMALIGARTDDIGPSVDQGSISVFTRNGTIWTQQANLTATAGAGGDLFGQSVALNGDGTTILVGALLDDVGANADHGSAYIFVNTDLSTDAGSGSGSSAGRSIAAEMGRSLPSEPPLVVDPVSAETVTQFYSFLDSKHSHIDQRISAVARDLAIVGMTASWCWQPDWCRIEPPIDLQICGENSPFDFDSAADELLEAFADPILTQFTAVLICY